MWECSECGCRGIAGDLEVCPQCGKEKSMPKATTGGASNAWEPTAPVAAPVAAETVPEVADVPAGDVVMEQPAEPEVTQAEELSTPAAPADAEPTAEDPAADAPKTSKARKSAP